MFVNYSGGFCEVDFPFLCLRRDGILAKALGVGQLLWGTEGFNPFRTLSKGVKHIFIIFLFKGGFRFAYFNFPLRGTTSRSPQERFPGPGRLKL